MAQASDFRMDKKHVAFLWWDQDSNPGFCETHSPADWMPAHKPAELFAQIGTIVYAMIISIKKYTNEDQHHQTESWFL